MKTKSSVLLIKRQRRAPRLLKSTRKCPEVLKAWWRHRLPCMLIDGDWRWASRSCYALNITQPLYIHTSSLSSFTVSLYSSQLSQKLPGKHSSANKFLGNLEEEGLQRNPTHDPHLPFPRAPSYTYDAFSAPPCFYSFCQSQQTPEGLVYEVWLCISMKDWAVSGVNLTGIRSNCAIPEKLQKPRERCFSREEINKTFFFVSALWHVSIALLTLPLTTRAVELWIPWWVFCLFFSLCSAKLNIGQCQRTPEFIKTFWLCRSCGM